MPPSSDQVDIGGISRIVGDAPSRRAAPTLLARVRRRLSAVAHGAYLDLNRDHRATVLLCGSGRSGTTWVVEVANYDNHYRLMIEPFYRANVPAVKAFRRRQYLRPTDSNPTYLGPATAIFTGALRDAFVDQLNRRFICSTRIVKDVRSTLVLGWLRTHFPGMPIVLLLRHPYAVAASRVRLGWEDIREDYLGQPDLVEDYLAPFEGAIRCAKTEFERHVFDWCVENYVPFRQLARGDVHLAFYENFCIDPVRECNRLFEFLGRPYDERIVTRLMRPTFSGNVAGRARPTATLDEERLTESWRKHFSPSEIERASEIVASFGLERIYGSDSMPDLGAALETFAGPPGPLPRAPG